MANSNAVMPFAGKVNPKDVQETIGVTQLAVGGDIFAWHQTVGGLIFQGGRVPELTTDGTVVIPLNVPFPQRCLWLGLTVTGGGSGFATTLNWVAASNNDVTVTMQTEGALSETQPLTWFAIGI
jgi:hypothetical protein